MNMHFVQQLDLIKAELLTGVLSYAEAKAKAQPVLDEMNARAAEIAKKYKRKHTAFTFAGIMR